MKNFFNPQNYTFIVPVNDGESKMIVEICHTLSLDVRISSQKWGAQLEKEPEKTFKDLKQNVVIIEMPGKAKEEEIQKTGHRVIIIDHHLYKNKDEVLDRRAYLSSLEQFAQLVGYTLNRFEKALALNDRGYIGLLKDKGYTAEEIDTVRRYDLTAQGYKKQDFEHSIVDYERGKFFTDNNLYFVKTDLTKVSYLADLHYLNSQGKENLLVVTGNEASPDEVNFFGEPQICKAFFAQLGGWIGGDESRSMFWGCHKDAASLREILLIYSQAE